MNSRCGVFEFGGFVLTPLYLQWRGIYTSMLALVGALDAAAELGVELDVLEADAAPAALAL